MTDPEIFDKFLSRRGLGRRVELEQYDPTLAAFLLRQKSQAESFIGSARDRYPKVPDIHVDFVQDFTINAFAFADCGRYFIAINLGTVVALNLIFNRMLADRRILESVGKSKNEKETLPICTSLGPDILQLFRAGIHLMRPIDSDRAHYAVHLLDLAMSFLFVHELTLLPQPLV